MAPAPKNSRYLDEDIVISGISGRFPNCNSNEEFHDKLKKGCDLVDDETDRWPKGFLGTYPRIGTNKTLKKFDAQFFNIHPKLAERLDPIVRVLLQVSHEAVLDAGISSAELRGSETGVIAVVSSNEAADWWSADPYRVNGYEFLGCTRTMYSNRISFAFDLKGPSYTMDCQAASSLFGLEQAYYMLKTGMTDAVIVAGANLILNPHFNLMFQKLNLLSPDGRCKVFDDSADGYVRSEAGVAVILQRRSSARRIYATVKGIASIHQGFNKEGCTVPTVESQMELFEGIHEKFNIDPLDVTYIEAHGYSNVMGDSVEANAIASVYCANRKDALKVGCVKSNMGDAEPASGLVALAKVLLIAEEGIIPPNLHYATPNSQVSALSDGRIKVVDKLSTWNGKLIAINSFGFGGTISHIILEPNVKKQVLLMPSSIPRLLLVSGRNEHSTQTFLEKVKCHSTDNEFCGLVQKVFSHHIPHYDCRAFSVVGKPDIEEITNCRPASRPVVFVFSGMGSQWVGMGKDLMSLSTFRTSVEKCNAVLMKEGFCLLELLQNEDENTFDSVLNSFVGITCIQVALVDMLRSLNIHPDFIVGHSVGELACAYADGTLTLDQAASAAFWRAKSLIQSDIAPGSMAAIGLSFEEVSQRIPSDIIVACHNSSDSITISGPPQSIRNFTQLLHSEGIFAREVNSSGLAFHSHYIASAGPNFKKVLQKIIPQPKLRTKRWISTSVPEKEWNTTAAKYSSVEYHLNNLLSPVLFQEALTHIPDNSVVIEVAPHALLQSILKRGLKSKCTYVGLVRRNHSTVTDLLTSIGRLYNAGLHPSIENLYPPVEFPVGRSVPMLQSMVQWDHSQDWFLVSFLLKPPGCQGQYNKVITLSESRYKFLLGSIIDGCSVLPAAAYVSMIWEAVATFQYKRMEELPIVIQDLQILKSFTLVKGGIYTFVISILEGSEECEIREDGELVAKALITIPPNIDDEWSQLPALPESGSQYLPLRSADVYKELRTKGYDYRGTLQGIRFLNNAGERGIIRWSDNWVSFIECMFQMYVVSLPPLSHEIVNYVEKITLNPVKLLNEINSVNIGTDFAVEMSKQFKLLKAPGVELRGIKSALCSPAVVQNDLRSLTFVPHFSDKQIMEQLALVIATQVIIENSNLERPLHVTEVVNQQNERSPCVKQIYSEFSCDPFAEGQFTIYAEDVSKVAGSCESLNIHCLRLKHLSEVCNNDIDVLVIDDQFVKSECFGKMATSVKEGSYFLCLLEDSNLITEEIGEALGLKLILCYMTERGKCILLRKPLPWKTSMMIPVKNGTFGWVESVKVALQKHKIDDRETTLLFSGDDPSGVLGFMKSVRRDPLGKGLRCLCTDSSIQPYSIVDLTHINYLRKGLVYNIHLNGQWGSYRHLKVPEEPTVETEHASLVFRENTVASAAFIESDVLCRRSVGGAVENVCYVYYAALLPDGLKYVEPSSKKKPLASYEYCGRLENGSRVFGVGTQSCLGTSVLTTKYLMWPVPKAWTMAEAVTVPGVYCAAYNGLLVRGNLKSGETLFIFASPYDSCFACLKVALSVGANVIVGCSTETEKKVLMSSFPELTDKNIVYLNDATDVGEELLELTAGAGVNVIFNFKHRATTEYKNQFVNGVAMNGRIIEFDNKSRNAEVLGCAATDRNIIFHKISANNLLRNEQCISDRQKLHQLLSEGIRCGVVVPIASNIFSEFELDKAYECVKSRPFAKVAIQFREDDSCSGVSKVQTKIVRAYPAVFLDPNSSFIVTGGLTYMGVQFINWLISKGARKIVISSLYQPVTGYQHFQLRRWLEAEIKVTILNHDISIVEQAEALIMKALEEGPVAGIFHLSKVACPSALEESTQSHWTSPWNIKVERTRNLDIISRKLCPDLKYFVGISHVSSACGLPGHANISFACSAAEDLFEKRHKEGLPSTVIQLGVVEDEDEISMSLIDGCKLVSQKVQILLSALPRILHSSHCTFSLIEVDKNSTEVIGDQIIEEISDIMGMSEFENVTEDTSLQALGLEPVALTEIKKIFELNNIFLEGEEIRELTFDKIRSLIAT